MKLLKRSDALWEILREGEMRVPGLIYADDNLIRDICADESLKQVANAAVLPGVVKASMAMPDIHYGYGLPIGGVLATDLETGVVTPGGVGFDINCGVRLLRTELNERDLAARSDELIERIYKEVPAGVGKGGALKLSRKDLRRVAEKGAAWAVERGFGLDRDLDVTESNGALPGANPDLVSVKAFERGKPQLGSLGAGNHFIEIQAIDRIFDKNAANAMGLHKGFITCMIHTGSRGFGHQICTDFLVTMDKAVRKYGIKIPDRQLACAPISSPEGKNYIAAMACGANFAWANRQCIMHWVRSSFESVFDTSYEKLGMFQVYDVAHNIVKIEEHVVSGKKMKLAVHRKGATRAFGPGHADIPEAYRKIGQPVLIPGDMGTESYILVGTETAMNETFGSACHGAGRVMSRTKALKVAKGRRIDVEMKARGIRVMAHSRRTLAEEMSEAYKDVSQVVEVVHKAGISRKVARLKPILVVKG